MAAWLWAKVINMATNFFTCTYICINMKFEGNGFKWFEGNSFKWFVQYLHRYDTWTFVDTFFIWSYHTGQVFMTGNKLMWFQSTNKSNVKCQNTLHCLDQYTAPMPTRTAAFCDPPAPWLPILVIHIRSQVKTRWSQSYKFKKLSKLQIFKILQLTLHVTHLLKLLDKMYKYEMDPTRTVSVIERTRDAGRTDRRTDVSQYEQTHNMMQVWTGKLSELQLPVQRTEWNQYTPLQLPCAKGI